MVGAETNEFNYGGQAVMEGVMMRGSKAFAVAVRDPEGEIIVHTEPLNQNIYGGRWSKVPFLRGSLLLWDALGLGTRALMFSADIAFPEESPRVQTAEGEKADPADIFRAPMQWGVVLASLSMSIGLFFALPAAVASLGTGYLEQSWGMMPSDFVNNLVEGGMRLLLLIGYIWGVGRLEEIQRLFRYHGAEHKTINAYEAEAELTAESVARFPLEHPRCGTGFLLTVVLISIVLYTIIPLPTGVALWQKVLWRVGTRILFLPVIAGIAYEFLRWTAKHQHITWVRWMTRPNLALQKLTTSEPDKEILEVSIAAFEAMMALERGEDASVVVS